MTNKEQEIVDALNGRIYCLVVETEDGFCNDLDRIRVFKDKLTFKEATDNMNNSASWFWSICQPYTKGYIARMNNINVPINK